MITQQWQIAIPVTVVWVDSHKRKSCLGQVIRTTVALGILILELIAELQIGLTENRLTISGPDTVIPILGGRHGISVSLIGRVFILSGSLGEILHKVIGHRFAHSLTVITIQSQSNITASTAQPAIDLQHSTNGLRIAIGEALAEICIFYDRVRIYQTVNLWQRVCNTWNAIRVSPESSIKAVTQTVVGVIAELRTQHDVP